MKAFGCKDVGEACEWNTMAETEDEIMRETEAHARAQHGYSSFTDQMRGEVRARIREIRNGRPEATLDRISLAASEGLPRGEGVGQINRRTA